MGELSPGFFAPGGSSDTVKKHPAGMTLPTIKTPNDETVFKIGAKNNLAPSPRLPVIKSGNNHSPSQLSQLQALRSGVTTDNRRSEVASIESGSETVAVPVSEKALIPDTDNSITDTHTQNFSRIKVPLDELPIESEAVRQVKDNDWNLTLNEVKITEELKKQTAVNIILDYKRGLKINLNGEAVQLNIQANRNETISEEDAVRILQGAINNNEILERLLVHYCQESVGAMIPQIFLAQDNPVQLIFQAYKAINVAKNEKDKFTVKVITELTHLAERSEDKELPIYPGAIYTTVEFPEDMSEPRQILTRVEVSNVYLKTALLNRNFDHFSLSIVKEMQLKEIQAYAENAVLIASRNFDRERFIDDVRILVTREQLIRESSNEQGKDESTSLRDCLNYIIFVLVSQMTIGNRRNLQGCLLNFTYKNGNPAAIDVLGTSQFEDNDSIAEKIKKKQKQNPNKQYYVGGYVEEDQDHVDKHANECGDISQEHIDSMMSVKKDVKNRGYYCMKTIEGGQIVEEKITSLVSARSSWGGAEIKKRRDTRVLNTRFTDYKLCEKIMQKFCKSLPQIIADSTARAELKIFAELGKVFSKIKVETDLGFESEIIDSILEQAQTFLFEAALGGRVVKADNVKLRNIVFLHNESYDLSIPEKLKKIEATLMMMTIWLQRYYASDSQEDKSYLNALRNYYFTGAEAKLREKISNSSDNYSSLRVIVASIYQAHQTIRDIEQQLKKKQDGNSMSFFGALLRFITTPGELLQPRPLALTAGPKT